MKKIKAFTLSEALVTLVLLGIVTALTLPFFIDSFQKEKWALSYKRSFSETYNALTRLALEEDCAKSLTCTHVFDGGQIVSTQALGNGLTKVMATKINCGTEEGSCFSHNVKVGFSPKAKEESLMETMITDIGFHEDLQNFYTFQSTRGVSYAVFSFGMNCLNIATTDEEKRINEAYIEHYVNEKEGTDISENQMLSLCGFAIMDMNGAQKPNVWGRDVFGIWLTDRSVLGVYPFGGEYDKRFYGRCNSDSSQDTRGCAAQIIKDGWKMLY